MRLYKTLNMEYVEIYDDGSVNPTTGEYNFNISEGYIVQNGKTKPIKSATLIGDRINTLKKIDRVGNNIAFGNGTCSSRSGNIPVTVGQAMIRVSELTVGRRQEV